MNEIVKALNEINGSIVEFQGLLHADLLCLKHELMEANELKQKEIQEALTLGDNFGVNNQKIDALKDCLNTVISTVNQHSEALKMIMDCVSPFVDDKGNTMGNYDCCKDDKKKKKR